MPSRPDPIDILRDGARTFTGELYRAPRPRGCGVVMLSSLLGVDDDLRAEADGLLAEGCDVFIPDLFWRSLPGPIERARMAEAMKRMDAFDVARGIEDTAAAVACLRGLLPAGSAVAAIGFCFGGRYAFTAAIEGGIDAAIAFHADAVDKHLDRAAEIRCPVALHYGGRDKVVPMATVERIRAAVPSPPVEVFVYPEAVHGFSMKRHPGFDPAAAGPAWQQAVTLLGRIAPA